jgi:hypothetical protein
MSRIGNPRLRKTAKRFAALARTDAVRFHREWNRRVSGWLYEIHNRARYQGQGNEVSAWAENAKECELLEEEATQLAIFDLLDHANNLIAACGDDVEKLVGAQTRSLLSAECTKAVAGVYGRQLYRLVGSYKNNV